MSFDNVICTRVLQIQVQKSFSQMPNVFLLFLSYQLFNPLFWLFWLIRQFHPLFWLLYQLFKLFYHSFRLVHPSFTPFYHSFTFFYNFFRLFKIVYCYQNKNRFVCFQSDESSDLIRLARCFVVATPGPGSPTGNDTGSVKIKNNEKTKIKAIH